jgi:hypothetical protein
VAAVLAKDRETAPADRYAAADESTRTVWNREAHLLGLSTVDYLEALDTDAANAAQADAELVAIALGARRN